MLPQDPIKFDYAEVSDWLAVDEDWFDALLTSDVLSVGERVHLARVALQQQWVCDIEDTRGKRDALRRLGLHIVAENLGFLIVSGSPTLARYVDFRHRQLTPIEAGLLYGYPPSAVAAFTGLIPLASPQHWPTTCAEYFLGGAYSKDHGVQERESIARHWAVLKHTAPRICEMAEIAFQYTQGWRRLGQALPGHSYRDASRTAL